MKKFLLSLLFAVPLWLFFSPSSGHWHSNSIPSKNLYETAWEPDPLTRQEKAHLEQALQQPYRYLAEGGQSYVFTSEDGRYVLKFFKFHRYQNRWFVPYLPNVGVFGAYKNRHIDKRKTKLNALLQGHQIAYDLLRDESGLLYLQLKASDVPFSVEIINDKGEKQEVDLSRRPFVLQQKGVMLSEVFSQLLKKGAVSAVKAKMRQVVALYRGEYAKGVYDTDHGVMHNVGFIGDRAIHLDVGNFKEVEKEKREALFRQDHEKITKKMNDWLEKNSPSSAKKR